MRDPKISEYPWRETEIREFFEAILKKKPGQKVYDDSVHPNHPAEVETVWVKTIDLEGQTIQVYKEKGKRTESEPPKVRFQFI